MRISTAQIFDGGIGAIQRNQASLATTQQQLATGKRILKPSDDPSGAIQSLKLGERIAAVDQYARNADAAVSRLQQQESVLTQISEALQRVRELTLQAANGTQSNESRAALALEIRQLAGGLLDGANARDASGEYMFAGYRSGSQPFVRDAGGAVAYLGDGGQRRVALSPDRSVAVGESGQTWMSIPRGNGIFTVTPDAGNAGTGRVVAGEVLNPLLIDNGTLELVFTSAENWQLRDSDGLVLASGAYVPDQAIDYAGRRIVLSGTPQTGDSFAIEPAGVTSLFAIVDALAVELATPRNSAAANTLRDQSIASGLQNIDQALARVLALRTDVGARLNTIDSQGVVNEDQKLQLQTALLQLQDLDYAEAISRFNLQQVALQAAQQSYVQLGRLSLFDFIR